MLMVMSFYLGKEEGGEEGWGCAAVACILSGEAMCARCAHLEFGEF